MAYADIVVYYDKDTSEVQFIVSDKQRVKLSSVDKDKLKSKKLKGDIKKYDLTEAYTDYKLKGGRLIINTKKISEREDILDEDLDRLKNLKSLQTSAKTKLIELGLTEEEFKSLIE